MNETFARRDFLSRSILVTSLAAADGIYQQRNFFSIFNRGLAALPMKHDSKATIGCSFHNQNWI